MADSDKHEGGCLCGEVRFQVSGNLEFSAVCHCRYCQLRTGSALGVSVYFQKENVKITQGTLKSYKLINESGKEMDFQFCAACGSTLLWDIELLLDLIGTSGGPMIRLHSGIALTEKSFKDRKLNLYTSTHRSLMPLLGFTIPSTQMIQD